MAAESAATNSFLEFSPRSSHVGGEETEFDGILSSRLRIVGVTQEEDDELLRAQHRSVGQDAVTSSVNLPSIIPTNDLQDQATQLQEQS